MTRLARTALVAAIALGGAFGSAGTASAAMPSAAPLAASGSSLLEDVRYVQRCRPVIVNRYDRFGRPVQVRRNVCRQVWVGGRRRGYDRGY